MRLKVRLEGSTRTILIPMDQDFLVNTENVVPSLGLLYSDVESKTLENLNDATLSRSIAGLALRVSFSTYFFLVRQMQSLCFVLTLRFYFLSLSDCDIGN